MLLISIGLDILSLKGLASVLLLVAECAGRTAPPIPPGVRLFSARAVTDTFAMTTNPALPDRDITPGWLDAALCSCAVLLFVWALSLLASL